MTLLDTSTHEDEAARSCLAATRGPTRAAPDFFALAKEIVATQQEALSAYGGSGVSWSGMARPAPVVETVEAVAERLENNHTASHTFHSTPRGRFLSAVDEMEQTGFWVEGDKLRGIYNRSLATLNGEALDVAAVGAAITILTPIKTQAARDAIDALAELLMGGVPRHSERRAA